MEGREESVQAQEQDMYHLTRILPAEILSQIRVLTQCSEVLDEIISKIGLNVVQELTLSVSEYFRTVENPFRTSIFDVLLLLRCVCRERCLTEKLAKHVQQWRIFEEWESEYAGTNGVHILEDMRTEIDARICSVT